MKTNNIILAGVLITLVVGALYFSGKLTFNILGGFMTPLECVDGVCDSSVTTDISCYEIVTAPQSGFGESFIAFRNPTCVACSCALASGVCEGWSWCPANRGVREGELTCDSASKMNLRAEITTSVPGVTVGVPVTPLTTRQGTEVQGIKVPIYASAAQAGCLDANGNPDQNSNALDGKQITVRLTNKPATPQPPPNCAPDWQCTGWGDCNNGQQGRTCTDANNCNDLTGRPIISQSCTGPCVADIQCSSWSECLNLQQTRTCSDANGCGIAAQIQTQGCTELCIPGTSDAYCISFSNSTAGDIINNPTSIFNTQTLIILAGVLLIIVVGIIVWRRR